MQGIKQDGLYKLKLFQSLQINYGGQASRYVAISQDYLEILPHSLRPPNIDTLNKALHVPYWGALKFCELLHCIP